MSIGEYYKLLMEGKRPTRQRTITPNAPAAQQKEEVKQPLSKSAGGNGGSMTPQTSSNKTQILGRSMSEHVPPSSGQGGQQNIISGQKNSNKRKIKLKHKMRQQIGKDEKGRPNSNAGVPPFLTQKQSMGGQIVQSIQGHHLKQQYSANNVTVLKSHLGVKPNESETQSTLTKLRQRENQKPRLVEKPKRPKKPLEGASQEGLRREEVRVTIQLGQKFEMIEVHPLFANGRLACPINEQAGVYNFSKVQKIRSEGNEFFVTLEKAEDEEEQKTTLLSEEFPFDQVIFASKVFSVSLIQVNQTEALNEHFYFSNKDDSNILLIQLVTPNTVDIPRFAALLPSNKIQAIEITIKEDLQSILKVVNEYNFSLEEEAVVISQETYKAKGIESLKQTADLLNRAYQTYESLTSKINVTIDNLEEYLFTQVLYTSADQAQSSEDLPRQKLATYKQGVFLRAKFDQQYYHEHLLFIKKLSSSIQQGLSQASHGNQPSKDSKSEWIPLSKYRVFSDISRGFISLECLATTAASDNGNRLKKRNIKYIGYRESLRQRKAIRQISQEPVEEDSCGLRKAVMERDSSKRPGDRCVICNYQAQGYDHVRCGYCSKVFHEQCCILQVNKGYQLFLGARELQWRCPDCIRCVNCLSTGGKSQASQLLVCKSCNSAYHYDCMDPSVKMSMPNIIPESASRSSQLQSSLPVNEIEFHCEKCVQCEQCGAREAGKNRLNKWSKDFKLCSNCNKKRKKNQYCLVCECFWPDDVTSEDPPSNQFVDYFNQNLITCGTCHHSLHTSCDRIFDDPQTLKHFKEGGNTDLKYNCQSCRQNSRGLFIRELVENLASHDKFYIFLEPVENQIEGYSKIIKTPMCFQYVKQRAQQGMYLIDPQALKRDISLIFDNAIKFNLPKHRVHKEAIKLKEICSSVLEAMWTRLNLNSQRTLEENRHRDWLRLQRRLSLKISLQDQGQKLFRSVTLDEKSFSQPMVYSLTVDELYDQTEFDAKSSLGNKIQDIIGTPVNDDQMDEDDDEQEEDDGSGVKKRGQNSGKKNLRARKSVNYNEERGLSAADIALLPGQKRGFNQDSALLEGSNRFALSSKRARFNQQQQQHSSAFSFNASSLKGTSLLQQALHQQEDHHLQQHQLSDQSQMQQQVVNHVQQQQQMMISYYQEIDDERCYYSNPARCSFDDPSLVFEEMCYLCGSFGCREDFLSCTLCGESFHTYCLQLVPPSENEEFSQDEDRALIARFQPYWKCLNCKFCELCSSATQEAFLLYCDVCDKAFHSFCLSPPLKSIPKCQWKCQECFSCQKCNAKSFFDVNLHLKPGMNQLLDSIAHSSLLNEGFEFSQNFSLCYECGVNEHKKSFCKICQQKQQTTQAEEQSNVIKKKQENPPQNNVLEPQMKMIKCKQCGYYCHIQCSRLLPDGDEDGFDEDNFLCLECLLTGKSINHLIRETCEQYENMHQIIARQRLLGQICTEILGEYFEASPEKAQIFIKSFIEQNQVFFKTDPAIQDWLSLLETGVCFSSNEESTVAEKSNLEENKATETDQEMKEIITPTKKVDFTETKESFLDIYKTKMHEEPSQLTEAEQVYLKMYGHKESFLPPKRSLYEALASSEGYHRFGQRQHFLDPFAQETQSLITLPLDENLQQIDFAALYTQFELKAVIKLKLQFFSWFEQTLSVIVERNLSSQRKKNQVEESLPEVISQNEASSFIIQDVSSSAVAQRGEQMCTVEDVLVLNPQRRLQCIMCKEKGELTVTGRLIPFQVNQFVHVNCALWSTDVHEIADGGYLMNFFQVWTTKAKFTQCWHCGESGASLFCHSSRQRCQAAYHFPCAYRNKKLAFAPRGTKETFCEACCRATHKAQALQSLGLPIEYANTKRRFQIAKNQQPWNMTHHMTSLVLQQQSLLAPQIQGVTSAQEIEKPLQIEKWRPFYFDMFNRVGNLTVLSLRKEINQIIEEYCCTSNNANSSSNNAEQNRDFSTVRIYWRYLKGEDQMEVQGNPGKAIYLYQNNNLKELAYNDLEALLPFVSSRILEKVNLGLHYLSQDSSKFINQARAQIDGEMIPALNFWQKLISHFQKERSRFSLQNIIFSISEFSGKTKYPVSIWNRAAEGVKNKSSFFLRSGEQVLHMQGVSMDKEKENANGTILPLGYGSLANTISGISLPKKGDLNGRSSLDEVFRRMTKINQMGEHQNPLASVKRVNASKHMQYESVLHNLGKKMFYRAPPVNAALFDEIPAAVSSKQTKLVAPSKILQKKIRQTDSVTVGNEKQFSSNNNNNNSNMIDSGVSKEADLPIAMKYRMSKTQPKRVEVGPSKIHRNGLFTLEDLAGGDIVIEYVGERIRNMVADKREIVYEQKGIGDCYLFRLDREYIIDATFNGNKARYLNHSCDANCSAKIINVQQQKHIIICANRAIKAGEELTYNYNFDYEADKIDCFCGAATCLGRLN